MQTNNIHIYYYQSSIINIIIKQTRIKAEASQRTERMWIDNSSTHAVRALL